jgi:hypothetical protein
MGIIPLVPASGDASAIEEATEQMDILYKPVLQVQCLTNNVLLQECSDFRDEDRRSQFQNGQQNEYLGG